jgi:hypothetical protein
LHLVEQGQHITRIAGIALGHQIGKEKTARGLRCDPGLSAKLRGTIALAFDNGGNCGVVGVHHLTVTELFARGQSVGLFAEVLMVAHRCGERQAETLVLRITQGDGVFEALLGLESKGFDWLTECQELLFRLSHQLDEHLPVSSTAAAKPTHDLFECLREVAGLALELGRPRATLLGDVVDEF